MTEHICDKLQELPNMGGERREGEEREGGGKGKGKGEGRGGE